MYISSKKPTTFDFDLLIIGSGAAGGVAAHLAAGYGKKVGLVEAGKLGGDCPNYSCIPTKALLTAADSLRTMQTASRYGLKASNITYSAKSLHAFKAHAVASSSGESQASAFKSEGITTLRGHAHFLSPYVVSVGSHRYSARKFLIATGSDPYIPNIPGLAEAGYITYRQASELTDLPKSIVILGGGATAYEYGQIFSAFGARVHIVEQHSHLLHQEDTEVGDVTEAALVSQGVRVYTHAKVTGVSGEKKHKVISFEQHGRSHRIACDTILVASGKKPNVDIGLENTGIKFNADGIRVNSAMQTTKSNIYAAGDVVGGYLFTHVAVAQTRVAAHNMFHSKKARFSNHAIPRVFYGTPEVAAVGKTEHQLHMTSTAYQTAIAPIGILGRATTSNFDSGFVKIIATHGGTIIGASIVAPHAGEMLQELTLAINHGHRACDVAETIHPFPTWSEAIRIACSRIRCS